MRGKKKITTWNICKRLLSRYRAVDKEVATVLTIGKMHSQSVAYYESTVDEAPGPDGYYSEAGNAPAEVWVKSANAAGYARLLGVEQGQSLGGEQVKNWFNNVTSPKGEKLGRALRDNGVPGFDLTFCAPKSVSVLWGLSGREEVRQVVDEVHAAAVATALDYLETHAAYTRRWDDNKTLIVDKTLGLSGVKYEHRTSRAGDPHIHSHVLLANRQLCADGQARSLDGVSLYHEARAAGMLYQAALREELTRQLGVEWGEVTNGQADIKGLNDPSMLKAFSTRNTEIDQWEKDNGLSGNYQLRQVGHKITRRAKDLDATLSDLETQWAQNQTAEHVQRFAADLGGARGVDSDKALPTPEAVLTEVIAERSTFTRADVVEKCAEMIPVGALNVDEILGFVEATATHALESVALSVTPNLAREVDNTQREGSQRFTTDAVIQEVNKGIDLATTRTNNAVSADSIVPVEGTLSPAQAEAMTAVVSSDFLASVVVAPAGAGKTSSLKAARQAWEQAGKTVIGLAPTGKAADVMVGEHVAHESSTIARALYGADDLAPAQVAARLGWNRDTVVVVDEAGMVATPDVVRLLEITQAAQAKIVLVGDPQQYAAVKARSGMLATLAYELPDAVELTEVFRQRDVAEREASIQLRSGDKDSIKRAAHWYMLQGRLEAGSTTAMLDDALAGWTSDTAAGKDCLLVASTGEQVQALNAGAQKIRADRGELDLSEARELSTGQWLHAGDVLLTRKNDYDLLTSAGDVVRNGQRWRVDTLHGDGSISATRLDDTRATATIPASYLKDSGQLGYASTGHSAQGATVDVARVVAGAGQVDRASVYVPLTRGREGNYLYLAESMPGDTDTGHGGVTPTQRRAGAEYARDLLIAAAVRDGADQTPHQVWGTARADWALTRLAASGEFINDSPFTGTRMGDIMAEREAQRAERFSEFFTLTQIPPRKKQALTPQPEPESPGKSAVPVGSSPRDPVREAEKAVTALEEQRRVVAQQYRQIGEHLGQVQGREHQIGQQIEQVTRQITQAQQARDSRGWLAKMLKPNEGAEQIEQWSKQQADLERARVQVSQQRQGLERDLAQVTQQYQDIDGQYQRAQLERDGVKADQLVGRVSKHDLTDVLGRSRSRPGRGISGAPQFGVNRSHQRDNDPGVGL
ncbi:relaxase domain-containing protein [Corynebacterium sp. YIM 101645]|uniref:Relaxase domain-containing protein n=1 Tax=Corynebacterium lemuris TaxID=1859292 RepID=A0ABT2G3U2_9CORY|nr:MobF family relaxase [Corynebacterium lemuris]MCS5480952.1 relaxase domain-containing protein [Corynebacterium lemuris]